MPSHDFIVPHCTEMVKILYQDEQLLLVNKPSGLLSVPGKHPLNKDCLISRIQEQFPKARIVHRLDMDTSGIMVIALNPDCLRDLNRQFEQRQTTKHYHAVVFGLPDKDKGEIDLPLMADWPNRPLQKVDHDQGKPALTYYDVISKNQESQQSLLQLKPVTGRSHQLRIHLATIGHPVLGCRFYGHKQAQTMSSRLLLHASLLSFKHPTSGEVITGECPPSFPVNDSPKGG